MSNPQQQSQSTAITPKITENDITGSVLTKINAFENNGELRLPKDYSPENALKSAWLVLQDVEDKNKQKALTVCTKESIANALLKMIVWGLSPLKNQGYFIVYGNELNFTPDYSGNILLAKRFGGLKSIKANAIFEGDEFEFEVDSESGFRKLIKHKQTLESMGSNKIKGAYAVIELEDGTKDVEIMNYAQIMASWQQGSAKGASPAHSKFPDQMAIKTVINRACKLLIRSSDDSVLFNGDDETKDQVTEDVKNRIRENANKQEMSFDDAEVIEVSATVDYEKEKTETTNTPAPITEKLNKRPPSQAGLMPSLNFGDQ